jgi:hypothetical protein
VPPTRPPIEAFTDKISVTDDCWEWTGTKERMGYGQMRYQRRMAMAHRVAYMLFVGPIPEGMELDHLCRNRGCVNPDHLEPVDHRTNILRGVSPSAADARKTHCINGHP